MTMRVHILVALLLVLSVCGCGKKGINADDMKCDVILDSKLRSECLYNKSIALRNPTMCKDVTDQEIRARCIDELSIMLKQEYYCMNHNNLPLREACERKVGEAIRKDKAT